MKTADTQALPAPPNLIASLIAGFDTITGQLGLILFPLALDLFLWLGPRLSPAPLVRDFVATLTALAENQSPETATIVSQSRELWLGMGERLNLFAGLRSYPVGIPSLMASSQPAQVPTMIPAVFDVSSLGIALLALFLLGMVGVVVGALYFQMVSQAALTGQVQARQTFRQWPWSAFQSLVLSLIWAALLVGISIPGACLLSVFSLGGSSGSSIGLFLYAGLILWIFFPLLLSPHGIFLNRRTAVGSVKDSLRLSYRTFPQTSLFFLIVLILSEGLDLLWKLPAEDSWLTVVGIGGHSFVTTSLLAASFIYYHEADRWVQRVIQQVKFSGFNRFR